jgi:hypothetical protein
VYDIRAVPVSAMSAAPARAAVTPRNPPPSGSELAASGRVAIVVFGIVVACLAIFVTWGIAALRARRRARAGAREAADRP